MTCNLIIPARGSKEKFAMARKHTEDTYLVKWRNFASMLRCRMHILVRAEPTSLVAPGGQEKTCKV